MSGRSELDANNHDAALNLELDALIVRSVARWALGIVVTIALLDLAALRSWPFPIFADALRGPFYVLAIVVTLLATVFVTVAGYRFMTMGVERRVRVLFLIFLPAAALMSSVLGFLLLTAPR
jgi:hypothetical protein